MATQQEVPNQPLHGPIVTPQVESNQPLTLPSLIPPPVESLSDLSHSNSTRVEEEAHGTILHFMVFIAYNCLPYVVTHVLVINYLHHPLPHLHHLPHIKWSHAPRLVL